MIAKSDIVILVLALSALSLGLYNYYEADKPDGADSKSNSPPIGIIQVAGDGLSSRANRLWQKLRHNAPGLLTGQSYPEGENADHGADKACLLYTSPSPRDATLSRMPSSA